MYVKNIKKGKNETFFLWGINQKMAKMPHNVQKNSFLSRFSDRGDSLSPIYNICN